MLMQPKQQKARAPKAKWHECNGGCITDVAEDSDGKWRWTCISTETESGEICGYSNPRGVAAKDDLSACVRAHLQKDHPAAYAVCFPAKMQPAGLEDGTVPCSEINAEALEGVFEQVSSISSIPYPHPPRTFYLIDAFSYLYCMHRCQQPWVCVT